LRQIVSAHATGTLIAETTHQRLRAPLADPLLVAACRGSALRGIDMKTPFRSIRAWACGLAMVLLADTDLSVLNLDDRIAQMQLAQGVLNVSVRRIEPDQTYEIGTPNLALTVRQPGAYRVEVAPDGSATTIFVRSGQVEVYGEGALYVLDPRTPYRFTGTGLREYETVEAPQLSISTGAVGGVAWFPLGPREVYRLAYAVSRNYFERVNVSNTVVNTTVINNYYYNTNVTNVVYANRTVPGAVVAVPATAFVQSQPIAKQAVRVPEDRLVSRPVAVAPSVAPSERSVRGSAPQGGKPPAAAMERAVVAREAPPAAHQELEPPKQDAVANRGQPAGEDARKDVKPATPGRPPNVKVIAQRPDERPRAEPPAANAKPGGTAPNEPRDKADGARARPARQRTRRPTHPRRQRESRNRLSNAARPTRRAATNRVPAPKHPCAAAGRSARASATARQAG
jgi:hypothetical protein